jgi:hypothetical protein
MVKQLTQWQEKKAVALSKKGYGQKKIGLTLKVSKERVGIALRKAKIGKRRVSPFWSDVQTLQRLRMVSWKEAREITYHEPFWGKKRAARAGKKYKRWEDFWDWVREEELSEREIQEKLEEETEEYYFDTPK